MRLLAEKLAVETESTGFRPDVIEKVAHLMGLLDTLQSHFLNGKPSTFDNTKDCPDGTHTGN